MFCVRNAFPFASLFRVGGSRTFLTSNILCNNEEASKGGSSNAKAAATPKRIDDYCHALLPDDVDWDAPLGYKYLWLAREESVTLVPDGWFPVSGCWAEPWQSIFGEPAFTYGIGKEDVVDRSFFDTGVTVTGWKNVFPTATHQHMDAIQFGKTLLSNELTPELINHIHEHGKDGHVDSNEVFEKYNIRPVNPKTPIMQGYQVSEDTLVVSTNILKYNQSSTGVFDVPPIDMFLSVDLFCWKKQGKVMKVIYECPIEKAAEDRPTLTAIRELSIWNYYNEKAQFKNGNLEVKKV